MGMYIIILIPFALLLLSLIITKEKINSLAVFSVNSIFLIIIGILNNIDSHSNIYKTITSFKLNMFNLMIFLIGILSSIIIFIFLKKNITSKFRRSINLIVFIIGFILEFLLIKIYFSCQ